MKESNILLANFLGLEKQEDNTYFDYEVNEYININDLNYNESWDILMNVVSKCLTICWDNGLSDWKEGFADAFLSNDINCMFSQAERFVEWWNEENN